MLDLARIEISSIFAYHLKRKHYERPQIQQFRVIYQLSNFTIINNNIFNNYFSMKEETIKGNWGSVFKTAMQTQRITANKLSIDLKIPLRSVYNYLSDTSEPTATAFSKIVNYLKITL